MADDFAGHGPYQLDPFNHIVAIHFPSTAITKLDFVNDRYKVRGQLQTLTDVVTNPEYRVAGGLDTRGQTSGSPDLTQFARNTFLKNKTGGPTAAIKGANNEFAYLDYTIVFEFDWFDREAAMIEASPGTYDSGTGNGWANPETFIETQIFSRTEALFPYNKFAMVQPLEIDQVAEGYPSTLITSTTDHDFWLDQADVNPETYGPGAPFEHDSRRFYRIITLEYSSPNTASFDWVWWKSVDDGPSPIGSWSDLSLSGAALAAMYPPSWGQSYLVTTEHDAETYVSVSDHMAIWDTQAFVPQFEGTVPYRLGPGAALYRMGSNANQMNGGLRLVHGRNRVALTVTADRIAACVNGGGPFVVKQPSTIPIPRVPYNGVAFTDEDAGFMFSSSSLWRCVWLFRKKVADDRDLRAMSVVQPLPSATSPKWDKPPGKDQ